MNSKTGPSSTGNVNDLRNVLRSQPLRQKQFGFLTMIAGIAGFIASMSYFGLFGKQIRYSGIFLSKSMIALCFVIFGLYGFGYALGGRKTGFSFAKWWTIFLLGCGVVGYLIRRFH